MLRSVLCLEEHGFVIVAEAYASLMDGHLQGIAGGAIDAGLGGVESGAEADIQTAIDAGKSQTQIDELQAMASGITSQRDSLFKGETLRELLLSAYAWSTVGMIAGMAVALMVVLVRRCRADHVASSGGNGVARP